MQFIQDARRQLSWTSAARLIAGLLSLGLSISPSTLFAYGPPLVEAASQNNFAMVQGLLRQGEDPNLAGFDGTTALMHATRHQNINMIRSLLEKGAEFQTVDRDGNLLVINESATSNPAIVSLYLDHGLRVNTSVINGRSLLMIASHSGATEAVQLLLSRGADIHAKDKTEMNALYHAIAGYGSKATVSHLLNSGAEVNLAKADGTTPLMEAARKGRADIVEMLIQKGSAINTTNNRSETALIIATQMGHTSVIRSLISHGANVSVKRKDDGATALTIAERMHIGQAVELLRAAGAEH